MLFDSLPLSHSLNASLSRPQASGQVFALRVGGQGVEFALPDQAWAFDLPPGWTGLLAVRTALQVRTGTAQQIASARRSKVNLPKLQVFIDRACPGTQAQPPARWASLHVPGEYLDCPQAFERWYVAQSMIGSDQYRRFASWLRRSECYQVVSFLLEEVGCGGKLCDLAARYGVSISHFRRLCHQALGSAAKPQLRGWRTAQALLALSPGKTLTDISLTFGYASPSHFSKEIRDLLGVAPSSLHDITRLSSK